MLCIRAKYIYLECKWYYYYKFNMLFIRIGFAHVSVVFHDNKLNGYYNTN